MKNTITAIENGRFEQVLLSHVEVCLGVAFALTHDMNDARDLTQEVMEWAWYCLDRKNVPRDIKKTLLIATRNKYIEKYGIAQKTYRTIPRKRVLLASGI